MLHRLAGSQCCGADHLLGKVCGYPSMNSHMMGSRWWYPSASWHRSTRRLTVLTIFICTSRLGAWQGWALLPRTIREIRGDPRSPGSTRQTRGIEPNLNLVSYERFYLIFFLALTTLLSNSITVYVGQHIKALLATSQDQLSSPNSSLPPTTSSPLSSVGSALHLASPTGAGQQWLEHAGAVSPDSLCCVSFPGACHCLFPVMVTNWHLKLVLVFFMLISF